MGLGHQCESVSGGCEYRKKCNIEGPMYHLGDVVAMFFGKFSIEDVLAARIPLSFHVKDKQ